MLKWMADPAFRDAARVVANLCHSGYETSRLKAEVIARLARVMPIEAVFWATTDPATVLPTEALRVGLDDDSFQPFLENEYMADDVNKFIDLARTSTDVRSLWQATDGDLGSSPRYREIIEPLGMGDELRAILRCDDATWGAMCIHAEAGHVFSAEEIAVVRGLLPHLGEGVRAGVLMANVDVAPLSRAPGLVLLSDGAELVGTTPSGEAWLADLAPAHRGLPHAVHAVVGRLQEVERSGDAGVPRARVRTSSGRWGVVHASRVSTPGAAFAVIIEEATPTEIASLIAEALGLTPREREITREVVQGRSSREIATALGISAHTVQDHLKSIFAKSGVRTRRELVAFMVVNHYVPHVAAARPVETRGYFRL
jgi:DNA-binding CsgD family transcriptional regulator